MGVGNKMADVAESFDKNEEITKSTGEKNLEKITEEIKKQNNIPYDAAKYLSNLAPTKHGIDYEAQKKTLRGLCASSVEFERAKAYLDKLWGYNKK